MPHISGALGNLARVKRVIATLEYQGCTVEGSIKDGAVVAYDGNAVVFRALHKVQGVWLCMYKDGGRFKWVSEPTPIARKADDTVDWPDKPQ